jgi:methylthioribose-1-phosphate isomerase
MKVNGKHYRSIWEKENTAHVIQIIDQRWLPHKFVIEDLNTIEDVITAIKEMHVRGAPLIGVTAAYGVYLALLKTRNSKNKEEEIEKSLNKLIAARPTAVNLQWAVQKVISAIYEKASIDEKIFTSLQTSRDIAEDDVENCKKIGEFGYKIIEEISKKKGGKTVNILTHCNAGWLATVDYGTATAPIYLAHKKGINVHVWVDETRPRNQGAKLTAWELLNEGIPHTVIVDNAGGHLMQKGMVNIVLVGSDRTALNGDVANKTGTYLKALAAKDNDIPFYVALPSSSIDFSIENGIRDIPIEQRDPDEVRYVDGLVNGEIKSVLVPPENSPAVNYAFDVTPARLVTGLITERGICKADKESILKLFPEKR